MQRWIERGVVQGVFKVFPWRRLDYGTVLYSTVLYSRHGMDTMSGSAPASQLPADTEDDIHVQ